MFRLKSLMTAAVFSALASVAGAESWTVNGDASHVAFGSVKKNTVGEVHSFETVTGRVDATGAVTVEIDLASVETLIDIRNERMVEHVFQNTPSAVINAQVDMVEVSGLKTGQSAVVDATGTISLAGHTLELDTEMFVMRVSDTQVLVTTHNMIMLSTADMGLTAGIDKLMELAKLPGITRVSPVTLRLVFDVDAQKAEAAPAADAEVTKVALSGDPTKGKKVFRKCKACHQLKEGKNGVGPSLFNIVGAQAGQVAGFSYSDAFDGLDLVWTSETMTVFLSNPKDYLPGNKMSFRGLRKPADIENLIAYLAGES